MGSVIKSSNIRAEAGVWSILASHSGCRLTSTPILPGILVILVAYKKIGNFPPPEERLTPPDKSSIFSQPDPDMMKF